MDNICAVSLMLDILREYRKLYISDFNPELNYSILCILANLELEEEDVVYKTEKDSLRMKRILDTNASFLEKCREQKLSEEMCRIWQEALQELYGVEGSTILGVKEMLFFELSTNEELLKIHHNSEKQYDKVNYDLLKMKLMSKRRK